MTVNTDHITKALKWSMANLHLSADDIAAKVTPAAMAVEGAILPEEQAAVKEWLTKFMDGLSKPKNQYTYTKEGLLAAAQFTGDNALVAKVHAFLSTQTLHGKKSALVAEKITDSSEVMAHVKNQIPASQQAQILAKALELEYQNWGSVFTDPNVFAKVKERVAWSLFKEYVDQLYSVREQTHPTYFATAKMALVQVYLKCSYHALGAKDFDKDTFPNIWEVINNAEIEKDSRHFEAIHTGWTTGSYVPMAGNELVPIMEKIDKIQSGITGRKTTTAYDIESKSAVMWLIGQEGGYTLPNSSLEESHAVSTTGVPYHEILFGCPKGTKLADGMDLQVDFLDRNGDFVAYRPGSDTLEAREISSGAKVTPKYKMVDGKMKIWFQKGDKKLDWNTVKVVIVGSNGKIKGDNEVANSYSAGWWGNCDKQAILRLFTTMFQLPTPTSSGTYKAKGHNGQKIEETFKTEEIKVLMLQMIEAIAGKQTFIGNRYDNEFDHITLKDGTVIECRIQTPINWYQSSMQRNGDTMTIDPKAVSFALGKNAEGKYHFPQEISYVDRFTGETKNVKIDKIASMDREDRKDIYPDEVLAQLAQTGPVLGGDYDSGDHVWNGTATLTTRAGDDVQADGATILTYKANKKPEWAERMLESVPISGSSETRKTLIGKNGPLSAEEMKKVVYYSIPYSQNGGGYAQEMNAWVLWSADGTTALNCGSDNNWDFHYYVDFKNIDWDVANPRNAGVSPKMVVEIYLSSLTPEQVKAIGEGENPFPTELIEKYSQSDRAVSIPEALEYYLTEVASAVTGNNSDAAPIEVSPNWPEGFTDYNAATWIFENKSYEVRYTVKETEYGAKEFTAYLKIDDLVYGPISANGYSE